MDFLNGIDKINIILGKNGCGKSTLLRDMNDRYKKIKIKEDEEDLYNVIYVSPERAGELIYDPNTLHNMQNPDWMNSTRNRNQVQGFKQQSYQKLSQTLNIARKNYESEIQDLKQKNPQYCVKDLKMPPSEYFIKEINKFLDKSWTINIDENDQFVAKDVAKGLNRSLSKVSSGEAEIITIAAECLLCFMQLEYGTKKDTILLLDEPDVHLHPDLQYKFIRFLVDKIADTDKIKIFIATHSTPILSALSKCHYATVTFLKKYQNSETKSEKIKFRLISESMQKILPVFGAHPLTSIYTKIPLLLLEGDTDEIIWQQVIRSSEGKIKFHPVVCNGIDKIDSYEKEASELLDTIYDTDNNGAKAYSLRDRDYNIDNNINANDTSKVQRLRLNCLESENLLLTDEILVSLETSWKEVEEKINNWLENNKSHKYYNNLLEFKTGNYDRQNYKIKDIISILLSFMNKSNKPWPFIIGQVIGKLRYDNIQVEQNSSTSIYEFLGTPLIEILRNQINKTKS